MIAVTLRLTAGRDANLSVLDIIGLDVTASQNISFNNPDPLSPVSCCDGLVERGRSDGHLYGRQYQRSAVPPTIRPFILEAGKI